MSSPDNVSYQIIAVTHGGNAMSEAIGVRSSELVQGLPIIYEDNTFAQGMPIQADGIEIEVTQLNLDDDIAKGAKGTLQVTAKQNDGGTTTYSVTNMKRFDVHRDQETAPHSKRTRFLNEGTPVQSVTV